MLRIVYAVVIIAVALILIGCGDDVKNDAVSDVSTSGDVHADSISTGVGSDALQTELEILETDASPADADSAQGDVADQLDVVAAPDVEEESQLPADPTEDPEGHSAFYSFPAWEVPPSSDDDK